VRSQEMAYLCVDNKVGKGTFKMFLCSCLNLEKSQVQFYYFDVLSVLLKMCLCLFFTQNSVNSGL